MALAAIVAVDNPLVAAGLQAALDRSDVARVVANLDAAEELEQALDRYRPDILVLDVRYRRADPDLVPRLHRRDPRVKILIFVAHTAEVCALRHLLTAGGRARLSPEAVRRLDECCLTSLRADAHGCLPAEATDEDVVRAVEAVAAGEVAAAPWLHAVAREEWGAREGGPRHAITARELEVMALLADGMGNKGIARRLGIREQTVKNHVAHIMEKLGLDNRAQVGLLAARHRLRVEEDPGG